MALVVVQRKGCWAPAVVLFASRDITAGEELCFAYGTPSPNGRQPCACGARECLSFLPSEAV